LKQRTIFPRITAHRSSNGVTQGRRESGKTLVLGTLDHGLFDSSEPNWRLPSNTTEAVRQSAGLWQQALLYLFQRFAEHPVIRAIVSPLRERELTVAFQENAETLAGLDDTGIPWMASEVASRLGMPREAPETLDLHRGFILLLGVAQIQIFLAQTGDSPRAALHRMLELYQDFTLHECRWLKQTLGHPLLDNGQLFACFLERAGAGGSLIERDQHITWLLGQDRLDLPYHRTMARAILGSVASADEQRLRWFEVLRNYDRELERNNRERLSAELRQSGQLLIFGRMSRAFHNQGLLFADAVWLQPSPDWPGLADELATECLDDERLVIAAGVLRLLLGNPDQVALVQLEGALERFEEAVLETQRRALTAALEPARLRVENHADTLIPTSWPALDLAPMIQMTERRLRLVERIRQSLLVAERRHAAYVIISQRPSPTGSHLLIKLNEFQDPYAGKPENLRKLLRLAGDRLYGSPDYGWLEVADHWIEAIPLFIREEIQIEEGRESTRTVIDLAAMEAAFREEMADHWANNLRRVLESEFLALARESLEVKLSDEETLRHRVIETPTDPDEIAALGLLLAEAYRRQVGDVQRRVEQEEWPPFEVMRQVLPSSALIERARELRLTADSWRTVARQLLENAEQVDREIARLSPESLRPRRPLPALHVLTTQSAGMTEGYVRTWLEESMALYNLVEDLGLQEAVAERQQFFTTRLLALGEQLIRELGLWVEVEELRVAERMSEADAIRRIVSRNRIVQGELSCLGTLLEYQDMLGASSRAGQWQEPEAVQSLLDQEAESESLRAIALERVFDRNGASLRQTLAEYRQKHPGLSESEAKLRIVLEDEYYRRDLETYLRITARRHALEKLDAEQPDLRLRERCRNYLRRFRDLAKTSARKEIIAERGLHSRTFNPLYYFRATGGGKRYHLLYTPSRVDLGERERESVETWGQWVGGADRAAAREGLKFYGLINKNVRVFDSLAEPEVLKTGENASMASHYAFSNALALMVAASRRGDFEAMADQMNRRQDRRIHPAGEGYGGYCVPKDGLFLEFVLSLSRREKLTQIGLPETTHGMATKLAHHLLNHQTRFSSALDWEDWAAKQMEQEEGPWANTRSGTHLFQATRIAQVIDGLGQPELRDAYRVATSLAARWGLHKMVTGGEQVNRFMPFFKVWLIRQALAEAVRQHPDQSKAPEQAIVVLSAEYKPDTQDGRFAAGMRKFEILAGTGAHLRSALDAEGQELALLLQEGDAALSNRDSRILSWLTLESDPVALQESLRRLFPAYGPPGEIRLVSPMGLSTQDLLAYTSDTRLTEIVEEVRSELLSLGYDARDLEANLRTHGPWLARWERRGSAEPILEHGAGRIHALALAVLGPEPDLQRALQGADVLDVGIPHRGLLEWLADPGRICRLMLDGNPHSALAIVDGASGARPRAMNRLDVMLWFAAGERLGREPIYFGIGLGPETVNGWRSEMRRHRRWAERLALALAAGDTETARFEYAGIVHELREDQMARAEFEEIDKLQRLGRVRERDRIYAEALARIAGGLPLESLEFADFLALGGIFLWIGASRVESEAYRATFAGGIARLGGSASESDHRWPLLLPEKTDRPPTGFQEERGVEGSNKATEERPSVALESRRQLAERLVKARALNERRAAFASIPAIEGDFTDHYRPAINSLGSGDEGLNEAAFGRFIGHTRQALRALARDLAFPEQQPSFLARIEELCCGRRIDPKIWQSIAGGYEDIGDFGRLAQRVTEQARGGHFSKTEQTQHLERIAQASELFEILLAVENTLDFTRGERLADPLPLWRALADFFARTLNDHRYEYRPWLYSRGIGFSDWGGEELYALAFARHAWLYRYLRGIAVRATELWELTTEEQDLLLGNFLDGQATEAIGAEAETPAERAWRAYGQLRELAFIRNDGFPLPVVIAEFDPDMIDAERRVNQVFAVPVGRTHFSRMLREGPTLSRQLEREGRPGANLIISRKIDFHHETGSPRPVVRIRSGHFYLDAETYRMARARHGGSRPTESPIHPKGIRIAARFTRPVLAALVYPFHGDPAYASGALENCGLPYTVQSLFHTWTTYDKAKYPDIFRDSGLELPAEIDWLTTYSAQGDEPTVKTWIRHGLPDTDYPGLLTFSERHSLVMVKDAAESGGRNMRAFPLRSVEGELDEKQLERAVDFVYQISRKHHVVVQEVVHCSPEFWATEAFMEDFVRRQILEWGHSVDRRRPPYTPIYGSFRLILSTDDPGEPDAGKKWHFSHWITLNSRQLITNVGRGGTLEQLLPEWVRPEHRDTLLKRLAEAGQKAMTALSIYEAKAADAYRQETGRAVGNDLLGISYGSPRYMMLDFLVEPIFIEPGDLLEIRPCFDENGTRTGSLPILQRDGRIFPGEIVDWRVVLIEPNIGVGLWDRVALREEVHELRMAEQEAREPDWDRVGENARIVLRDLNRAGEEYLRQLGSDGGIS
jgi:hypothetical protein